MCGIVGVVIKGNKGFNRDEIDLFTQMLYADLLRGKDGTGVFYNDTTKNNNKIKIIKGAIPSYQLISKQEYSDVENTLFKSSSFVVGHNRAATKGKINATCTHPFRENNITLVHNGTLTNQKELHPELEVDSHAICHSISTIGYKETLKKIEGAFSLVWFDSNTNTLNLCRNYQRPLNIIECDSCFIICSELELGKWIASRNNIKIIKETIVTPGTLYTFDINNRKEFKTETVEYYTYTKYSYPSYSGKKSSYVYDEKTKKSYLKFSFGEKIRFRTGNIKTKADGRISYVEGDILKYQGMDKKNINTKIDFEDVWRVSVYGAPDFLKTIANKLDVEGTINALLHSSSPCGYTVSNIKDRSSVVITSKEKDFICDFCDKSILGNHNFVSGYDLCDACANDLYN